MQVALRRTSIRRPGAGEGAGHMQIASQGVPGSGAARNGAVCLEIEWARVATAERASEPAAGGRRAEP